MIAEIISIASSSLGVYLIAKSKASEKKNDKKDDTTTVEKNEEKQNAEPEDPRSDPMYFGCEDEEYDPFYDFSEFDEEDLKSYNPFDALKAEGMRCRFVFPFFAESKERGSKTSRYYTGYCHNDYKPLIINIGDKVNRAVRDVWNGTYREYLFMMEIFNPLNVSAPVKELIFKEMAIGGQKVEAYTSGGIYHDSTGKQLSKVLRRWYDDVTNPQASPNATPMTYYPRQLVYDVDAIVPAKSSIYVPIFLQLVNYYTNPKFYWTDTATRCVDVTDGKWTDGEVVGQVYMHDGGNSFEYRVEFNEWAEKLLKSYVSENNFKSWSNRNMDKSTLGEAAIFFKDHIENGTTGIIINDVTAAPSLSKGNFTAKVLLTTAQGEYVQKGHPDISTPRTGHVGVFDLTIQHGGRPAKDYALNRNAWQNTYFEGFEKELPLVKDYLDVEQNVETMLSMFQMDESLKTQLLRYKKTIVENYN